MQCFVVLALGANEPSARFKRNTAKVKRGKRDYLYSSILYVYQ